MFPGLGMGKLVRVLVVLGFFEEWRVGENGAVQKGGFGGRVARSYFSHEPNPRFIYYILYISAKIIEKK